SLVSIRGAAWPSLSLALQRDSHVSAAAKRIRGHFLAQHGLLVVPGREGLLTLGIFLRHFNAIKPAENPRRLLAFFLEVQGAVVIGDANGLAVRRAEEFLWHQRHHGGSQRPAIERDLAREREPVARADLIGP